MVPCWNTKPENRPGFAELHRVLVELGAMDSGSHVRNAAKPVDTLTTTMPSLSPEEARLLLGPSVHHITTMLLQAVVTHSTSAELATIKDMVKTVVKPLSADKICPRDSMDGCAYVDLLLGKDHVDRSTALLSCTSFCPLVLSMYASISVIM